MVIGGTVALWIVAPLRRNMPPPSSGWNVELIASTTNDYSFPRTPRFNPFKALRVNYITLFSSYLTENTTPHTNTNRLLLFRKTLAESVLMFKQVAHT
jgi:hypothetical protein